MSDLLFELTTNISYANKGELVEGTFISLTPPSSKNMKECAFLKQAFFRAMNSITGADRESVEPPEGSETDVDIIDGPTIMGMITMSSEVQLSSVLVSARDLFTSGIASVEGEAKLTKPLIDLMSMDDLEDMTGQYLANFILASALRKMKKNLSPES